MLKSIFTFILCLLPWFLSSIIPVNYDYFDMIKTPFFTPPSIFYPIAWTIIYILIALCFTKVLKEYKFKELDKSLKIVVLVNYLFNQSFTPVFFGLNNVFLGFVSCIGTFISCLFLYEEIDKLKERSVRLLDPYILLSLFATILSLTIYLMNSLV